MPFREKCKARFHKLKRYFKTFESKTNDMPIGPVVSATSGDSASVQPSPAVAPGQRSTDSSGRGTIVTSLVASNSASPVLTSSSVYSTIDSPEAAPISKNPGTGPADSSSVYSTIDSPEAVQVSMPQGTHDADSSSIYSTGGLPLVLEANVDDCPDVVTISKPDTIAALKEKGYVDVHLALWPGGIISVWVLSESKNGAAESLTQSTTASVPESSKTAAKPVEIQLKGVHSVTTVVSPDISSQSSDSTSAVAVPATLQLLSPALSEGSLETESSCTIVPTDTPSTSESDASTIASVSRKLLVDIPKACRKLKDKLQAMYRGKFAVKGTY